MRWQDDGGWGLPEGPAEEAGDKEPGQAWQLLQKIHHKIQDKLWAEQNRGVASMPHCSWRACRDIR